MEDDCSGGRSQQTLVQHRNSNGNGKRKIGLCDRPESGFKGRDGEKADEEDCGVEVWSSLSNSFNQVQSVLDQNNVLIRKVNENQQSKIPDNLAKNVALIREINTNISKVHHLLKLYKGIEVPTRRLLFKIPSTWQGIEACRVLESEADAAAQAGASVIQVFVGRIRDWARNHSGDPEVEAALGKGEDPGLALVSKAYNYIHKYGYKSKLMAAAFQNKQDLLSLLGVDYIITPLKVLQSLKESVTSHDEKYAYIRRLSPQSASAYEFTEKEG